MLCLPGSAGRRVEKDIGHGFDDGFDAVPAGGDELAAHPELEARLCNLPAWRGVEDDRIAVVLSFDGQLLFPLTDHFQGACRRNHHPHFLAGDACTGCASAPSGDGVMVSPTIRPKRRSTWTRPGAGCRCNA